MDTAARSACDNGRPPPVKSGLYQSRISTKSSHRRLAFAQVSYLDSVIRGGIELPTIRFSGRTYPELARIVRVLCAVVGRCCLPLVAACCHRCCQPLVLFPISEVSPAP